MTIPSDPEQIKKLQELSERNIANGDWGDEVSIPGIPGESMPRSPDEDREVKNTVSHILSSRGNRQIPRRQ